VFLILTAVVRIRPHFTGRTAPLDTFPSTSLKRGLWLHPRRGGSPEAALPRRDSWIWGIGRVVHVPDPLVGTRSSTAAFDGVFAAIGARVIRAPVRAPRRTRSPNRFVGTVRRECLDQLLVFNEAHLRAVLADMARHYHRRRPHQGRQQQAPKQYAGRVVDLTAAIQRRQVLGGLISQYRRAA